MTPRRNHGRSSVRPRARHSTLAIGQRCRQRIGGGAANGGRCGEKPIFGVAGAAAATQISASAQRPAKNTLSAAAVWDLLLR